MTIFWFYYASCLSLASNNPNSYPSKQNRNLLHAITRNIVNVKKREITVMFCVKRNSDHSYSFPILDTPIETSLSTVYTPLPPKTLWAPSLLPSVLWIIRQNPTTNGTESITKPLVSSKTTHNWKRRVSRYHGQIGRPWPCRTRASRAFWAKQIRHRTQWYVWDFLL